VTKRIFKPGKSSRGQEKNFAARGDVVNPQLSARAVS